MSQATQLKLFVAPLQAGSRGPRALSEDAFEMLVDHFEKALHSLLQRQVELWPAVIDPALEPPDISGMYSLERACESEVSNTPHTGWTLYGSLIVNGTELDILFCGADYS